MEIKTSLNKPYTENEKMNFIVKQNHNLGYNIVETDTTLEAWGKTEEEIQAEENENKKLIMYANKPDSQKTEHFLFSSHTMPS